MASISLHLSSPLPDQGVISKLATIMKRHVQERCGVEVVIDATAPTTLVLDIAPGNDDDGFTISPGANGAVIVTGNSMAGLVHGLGKYLRTSTCMTGQFIPSKWCGSSTPAMPFRAAYLATHFFNFYHAAPMQQIREYIEDLALWGLNTIIVWYDMHHFTSIHDPKAVAFIDRLRALLIAAKELGLHGGLTLIANEAYGSSPVELRADQSFPGTRYIRGGYSVELCPSKPAAYALMLQWFGEEFKAFSSIDLDFLVIWPYDQGGCCCPDCRPWGANGFMRMGMNIARIAKVQFPRIKIIVSTWLFDPGVDEGEWSGLMTHFTSNKPVWADYILADSHTTFPAFPLENGVPGQLPMICFPEISMWGMNPWGGFGANPLPQRFQSLWNVIKDKVAGGMLYSEGIFEDINKVTWARFFWSKDQAAIDTLQEYVAYEFPGCNIDGVVKAILLLEQDHHDFSLKKKHRTSNARSIATEALALVTRANQALAFHLSRSWRWRLIFLRASLDSQRFAGKKYPGAETEQMLGELTRIYHAEAAEPCVRPRISPKRKWSPGKS